jgi:hypothetical protein
MKRAFGELSRSGTDRDPSRRRHAYQPRRDARRVALRDVVVAQSAADHADRHGSGVHAGTHAKVHAMSAVDVGANRSEIVLDRRRRSERADRVIVGAVDLAKQCHHAVAQKLVDVTAVSMHGVEDDLEGPLHDRPHVFGIEALGHRREPTDIDVEDGRLLALTTGGKDGATRAAELLLGRDGLAA